MEMFGDNIISVSLDLNILLTITNYLRSYIVYVQTVSNGSKVNYYIGLIAYYLAKIK